MAAAASFPDGSRWQYLCPFRKTWCDVGVEEDKRLKEGYLASTPAEPSLKYLVAGVRFATDFASMTRTNVASGRSTEVRLKGGALPSPPPEPGPKTSPRPSPASLGLEEGAPDESQGPDGTSVVPDALVSSSGRPVPFAVRRAFGQGLPEGVKGSGKFEFTMQLEDKDFLGEMLSWNAIAAGIPLEHMDRNELVFTDRRGQVAKGSKEAIQAMLDTHGSFPVKVKYAPKKIHQGMDMNAKLWYEVQRISLKAVQVAVAELNADMNNVKHRHQKKTFERYLLYLEDHYYQCDDDLSDVPDMYSYCTYNPAAAGQFSLTSKTLPNLSRVLRGEVDILEYLFGG